jgi:hypothetical protein
MLGTVASCYIFAHSVGRESIFKFFVSHLNITMIALYKKRPTLVRWSLGSVVGFIGAKVQHFSEIAVILYVECLFEVHFYVFFAVFSITSFKLQLIVKKR